jgi:type IV pilus assembly protein PilO
MDELVRKLLKLKTPHKVAITLGVIVVLSGLYYQFFYADIADEITAAEANKSRLTDELASYERRKIEYLAYRNELKQLQEEQRDLLRVLPKRDELASFLSSIQEQAELSGLEIPVFAPDAEVMEDLYVKIPVRMEVRGPFHAITKFFKSVSDMRRIVTVEDLALMPERDVKADAPTKLKAKFIAATYRYQDPNETKGGGS